jgi:hypothetical protein
VLAFTSTLHAKTTTSKCAQFTAFTHKHSRDQITEVTLLSLPATDQSPATHCVAVGYQSGYLKVFTEVWVWTRIDLSLIWTCWHRPYSRVAL